MAASCARSGAAHAVVRQNAHANVPALTKEDELMGGLTNLDAVFIAMAFCVPGYVYLVVRGHIVPGHRARGTESIIRLLSVSTVNFMIWAWAVYLVLGSDELPLWTRPAIWTFAILVSPAIMGLLSGLATKWSVLNWIYRKMKFHPVHIIPTSWDYAFAKPEPRFLIIKLADGGIFAGMWGSDSFASDEPAERDIYLEKVCKIDKTTGEWTETDRSVLIKGEHIRSVEFIPLT